MLTSEEHAKRRQLFDAGKTDRQIAAECFVSPDTICAWRLRHGLRRVPREQRDGHGLSAGETARRIRLWEQGWTDHQMARFLHLNPATVGQWRRRNGLPLNPALRREAPHDNE